MLLCPGVRPLKIFPILVSMLIDIAVVPILLVQPFLGGAVSQQMPWYSGFNNLSAAAIPTAPGTVMQMCLSVLGSPQYVDLCIVSGCVFLW